MSTPLTLTPLRTLTGPTGKVGIVICCFLCFALGTFSKTNKCNKNPLPRIYISRDFKLVYFCVACDIKQ